MINTYGLRSINSNSFSFPIQRDQKQNEFLTKSRNLIVTVFKVQNLCLNIMGYIPAVALYSGLFRIGSALLTKAVFLSLSFYANDKDDVLKKWSDEAQVMANAQIARGILEAFLPFGHVVNFYLDTFGTVKNLSSELYSYTLSTICNGQQEYQKNQDPVYPYPMGVLNLV